MRHPIVLVSLCVLAACERADDEAAAAETAPVAAAQACPEFPQDPDDGAATRPNVPEPLKGFVRTSETTLTVQRKSGPPVCIDISYGEVDSWNSFADGRLLGIGISGHEYNSYLVVDRNGAGEPIETGRAPVFSQSGRRFASADVSESAFGAFEALGVWEVTDRSVQRLMQLPGIKLLNSGGDWRLERWESEDCVIFSSANPAAPEGQESREFFELKVTGPQHLRGPVPPDAACQSPA